MDIFSRNKFLLRLVIVLVLVNLVSIGYLWYGRKDNGESKRPRREFRKVSKLLKEKLSLTDDQEKSMAALRQDFFLKEETLATLIRSERDSMNEMMFHETTDTAAIRAIATRVSENEYRMELYRLEQAMKLKAICTPEQRSRFREMVIDIRDYFRPDQKK